MRWILALALLVGCKGEGNKDQPGKQESETSAADEYLKKSKGTEALTMLKVIEMSSRQFAEMERVEEGAVQPAGFPKTSAGPTPPLGSCCKQGGKCKPDLTQWEASPWRELLFSIEGSHYFSYQYKVEPDGKKFTALAFGDLDCDGTYSTFSTSGEIGANGVVTVSKVVRENPLE